MGTTKLESDSDSTRFFRYKPVAHERHCAQPSLSPLTSFSSTSCLSSPGVDMIRTWNKTRGPLGIVGATLLSVLLLLGCGSSKGLSVNQYYGDYHPAGWLNTHGSQAVAGVDACTKCHEISIIRVGSGVPTCLTTGCHHQSTAGFADPAVHPVYDRRAEDQSSYSGTRTAGAVYRPLRLPVGSNVYRSVRQRQNSLAR